MKSIALFFLLVGLVASAHICSIGMGYPQDMFAEHMTAKKAPAAIRTKPTIHKASAKIGQKPSATQKAQRSSACMKPMSATKSVKKPNTQRCLAKQPAIATALNNRHLITFKTFHLDGHVVEEQAIAVDEWDQQTLDSQSLSSVLEKIKREVAAHLI